MNTYKTFYFVYCVFLLHSCNQITSQKYDLFETNKVEYIKKFKIAKLNIIEIGLDTSGNARWKRINKTEFYNKYGLIYMTVSPGYETSSWPTAPEGGLTQNQIAYNLKMSETNIQNGRFDTTFFYYDKRNNLIKIENNFNTTIKYDKFNNEIVRCFSSEFSENVCNYKSYEYDEDGQIVFRIDSTGIMSARNGIKRNSNSEKKYYAYDSLGRIVFDGEYERKFDKDNKLISVAKKNEFSNIPSEEFEFSYDKDGNKIKETYTRIVSTEWNSINNTEKITKLQTTVKYFYYDENGLLIQEKTLDETSKLVSLLNYEYESLQ
jgi:hypothetical protein